MTVETGCETPIPDRRPLSSCVTFRVNSRPDRAGRPARTDDRTHGDRPADGDSRINQRGARTPHRSNRSPIGHRPIAGRAPLADDARNRHVRGRHPCSRRYAIGIGHPTHEPRTDRRPTDRYRPEAGASPVELSGSRGQNAVETRSRRSRSWPPSRSIHTLAISWSVSSSCSTTSASRPRCV